MAKRAADMKLLAMQGGKIVNDIEINLQNLNLSVMPESNFEK